MELLEIARRLISIPSYEDLENNEQQDEHLVAEFISEYLGQLGYLNVERQQVEGRRFNLIAHDDHPARLMFCGHMDTVKPSGEWQHDPFGAQIEGDSLYGLGAADMKGGIASLLHALSHFTHTKGLFVLLDVDEERDFKGILRFLQEFEVHPDLAVFPEPGLHPKNGHRGLIEVHFRVRGVTGHAARPEAGKNAILGALGAVAHLTTQLEEFASPELGRTTCNLAVLSGGIDRGEISEGLHKGKLNIDGTSANKIPDLAQVVLDIRPAVGELRAQNVLDILDAHLNSSGFRMERPEKKLDYGALLVKRERLQVIEEAIEEVLGRLAYSDISDFGYGEGQLLNERFGTACVYFGPGPEAMAHRVDEYVSITEMQQASAVYTKIIGRYCI